MPKRSPLQMLKAIVIQQLCRELLEAWTGLVMVIVFSHNQRSHQIRNANMSYISVYEELCQCVLTLFSDSMSRGVKDRGKHSPRKHQDNIKISFAPQMNAKAIPTECSGNKGWWHPIDIKRNSWGPELKKLAPKQSGSLGLFLHRAKTHEPSWLITYIM